MDATIWPLVLVIGGALVVGAVSGLTPFLPVEAYVLSVAVAQPGAVAVGAAVAAGIGQSLAKVLIFSSVRSATGSGWTARLLARRRRTVLTDRSAAPSAPPSVDPSAPSSAEPSAQPAGQPARPKRFATARATVSRWNAAGLGLLSGRAGAGIVLLSGSVGLPPLLAVSAYAGASAMSRRTFAVTCLIGRCARFVTLALVPGWADVLGSHG